MQDLLACWRDVQAHPVSHLALSDAANRGEEFKSDQMVRGPLCTLESHHRRIYRLLAWAVYKCMAKPS
jgi:hypothetical protein